MYRSPGICLSLVILLYIFNESSSIEHGLTA
jgi:hypothetical protein